MKTANKHKFYDKMETTRKPIFWKRNKNVRTHYSDTDPQIHNKAKYNSEFHKFRKWTKSLTQIKERKQKWKTNNKVIQKDTK